MAWYDENNVDSQFLDSPRGPFGSRPFWFNFLSSWRGLNTSLLKSALHVTVAENLTHNTHIINVHCEGNFDIHQALVRMPSANLQPFSQGALMQACVAAPEPAPEPQARVEYNKATPWQREEWPYASDCGCANFGVYYRCMDCTRTSCGSCWTFPKNMNVKCREVLENKMQPKNWNIPIPYRLALGRITNWLKPKPKPVVMTRAIVGPWPQAWGIPYGPGNWLNLGFVILDQIIVSQFSQQAG